MNATGTLDELRALVALVESEGSLKREDIDLRTSERADAGVYVTQSAGQIIFRWQGVPCNFNGVECQGLAVPGSSPINFEIELNTDGTIRTIRARPGDSLAVDAVIMEFV